MTEQALATERQEALDLLVANIGAIPHPEYGVINLLPWAVESEQTDALKRQVCEAIVELLATNGLLRERSEAPSSQPARNVSLNCRLCSTPLLNVRVDDSGTANLPAATILSTMARMNPECPHSIVTPDDQRRKIEEAVRAANGE